MNELPLILTLEEAAEFARVMAENKELKKENEELRRRLANVQIAALGGDPVREVENMIYWSRKGRRVVAVILCIGAAVAFTIARGEEPGTYITYSATVGQGDTIWGIVSRIATNEDDLGALVFQTMRENGITNPGDLQPGQEIKVRVKARGASNHE